MIKLLVENGCLVNATNTKQNSPLHCAFSNPSVTLPIVKYLIEKKGELHLMNLPFNKTPLFLAKANSAIDKEIHIYLDKYSNKEKIEEN